jgi:hypothetical protein
MMQVLLRQTSVYLHILHIKTTRKFRRMSLVGIVQDAFVKKKFPVPFHCESIKIHS